MAQTLKQDMVGAIAYTLKVDGTVVEVISAQEAIEYLHGSENLVPGLEAALEGKKAGDKFNVTVAPEDGYGAYDEDDVEQIDRSEFEDFPEIQPGMEIEMVDDEGDVFEATVMEVNDEYVKLDFNAPLAGKTLEYSVEVISVREGTDEEVDMGLPASLIAEMFDDFEDDEEDEHDHSHN